MKSYLSLLGIILITLISECGLAQAANNSSSAKLEISEPWKEVTVKLVVPGSSDPHAIKSKTEEINVKRAVYNIEPPILGIREYSILLIDDPYIKKKVFIDSEDDFYVSDSLGIKGFFLAPGGVLVSSGSLVELPSTIHDDEAIAQFEKNFDEEKVKLAWEKRATVNRIGICTAVSQWYFSASQAPGNALVGAKIEAFDLTDGILRLDIRNPVTKIPASIWINLKLKRVIKSIVNGQEMDLSAIGTSQPYALPVK